MRIARAASNDHNQGATQENLEINVAPRDHILYRSQSDSYHGSDQYFESIIHDFDPSQHEDILSLPQDNVISSMDILTAYYGDEVSLDYSISRQNSRENPGGNRRESSQASFSAKEAGEEADRSDPFRCETG